MPYANDGGGAWNASGCFPIADDPDQPGDPCTVEGSASSGLDSCDIGAICWGVNADTNEGICTPQCTGSEIAPSCSDPTRTCTFGSDGVLTLCLPVCNPLIPETCPEENTACHPIYNGMVCGPDLSGPDGGPFQSCEFEYDCGPGTVCATSSLAEACTPETGTCCLPWCDLNSPDCPAGMSCEPWFREGSALPGLVTVGICIDVGA